jgi:hypothetical protein
MNKFWIELNGKSMSPLLRHQDTVLIEPASIESLKYGDIILYFDQSCKELTLHRLIGFPMKTKGDLSLIAEFPLFDSSFGKAIGFKREKFYRKLPLQNSIFTTLYLIFSKLRMKGFFQRKVARVFLLILTITFELCSEKTKLDHRQEQLLTDL